jgi:hypothetical protein
VIKRERAFWLSTINSSRCNARGVGKR